MKRTFTIFAILFLFSGSAFGASFEFDTGTKVETIDISELASTEGHCIITMDGVYKGHRGTWKIEAWFPEDENAVMMTVRFGANHMVPPFKRVILEDITHKSPDATQ